MLYRRFGRTGLEVPVFTCGGMRFQQSWTAGRPVSAASQRNLEATVDRALELGVHHFETARGYGTSEVQLGRALARHARERFILQTKGGPRADPREFERNLEESFERLGVDRIDLFAFHGLNNRQTLAWTLAPGGCYEVAARFRRAGRIGHLGFSTHGPCDLIVEAIETDRFDYVNLHYYYIFQDNLPAVRAAARHDMGVFIISPSDKGGRLWEPTDKLVALCAPLPPMVANDLFCLARPDVHTLSLGAARPSDFDRHLDVLPLLADPRPVLDPIVARLDAAYRDAVGADFAARWREGIPEWDRVPGGVNVRLILWLWNLARAYDLLAFARERYGMMTGADHWVPGSRAGRLDDRALEAALAASPFRREIPAILRRAHALLDDSG
jgi:hypothetical protein